MCDPKELLKGKDLKMRRRTFGPCVEAAALEAEEEPHECYLHTGTTPRAAPKELLGTVSRAENLKRPKSQAESQLKGTWLKKGACVSLALSL